MKAVVLEKRDKKAAVMTKDGRVIRIKDAGYTVGQEIYIQAAASKRLIRYIPAAVAAILFLSAGSGMIVYARPYGTVSLDINPSIEYTINRFDRVLAAEGINDDGSAILNELELKSILHKNIEEAMEMTIDQVEADGYLDEDEERYIVVSASTDRDEYTDDIVERLNNVADRHEGVKAIALKVSDEDVRKAHDQGISAGKLKMVDELEKVYGEEIDRAEWNKRSVNDIIIEYEGREPAEAPMKEPAAGLDGMPYDGGIPDDTTQDDIAPDNMMPDGLVPGDRPADMRPNEVPGVMPNDMQGTIPDDMQGTIPGDMPGMMPDDMPDGMTGGRPDDNRNGQMMEPKEKR